VQPARRGKIDILERGRMPEFGVPQALREAPLLAGEPLGIDEQAEGSSKLSSAYWLAPRCWSNASAIAIRRRVWSFSIVGCVSISLLVGVIGGAAHIFVRQRGSGSGGLVEGKLVLLVAENGFDGAIPIGAQSLRAETRGIEAIGPMDLAQPHGAQAGAVALLWMRPAFEEAGHEPTGGRPALFRPRDQA
jgi:hypothetical protein